MCDLVLLSPHHHYGHQQGYEDPRRDDHGGDPYPDFYGVGPFLLGMGVDAFTDVPASAMAAHLFRPLHAIEYPD